MSIFSGLRALVFLRRIARALEEISHYQHTLARLAVEADERRVNDSFRYRPKPLEVGVFSQAEASRNWRRQQIESGHRTSEELDEEYGPLSEGN